MRCNLKCQAGFLTSSVLMYRSWERSMGRVSKNFKSKHGNGKPLTEAELKRLRRHIQSHAASARQRGSSRPVVDEIIFFLLADMGIKPKELCQLNIGDLPGQHKSDMLRVPNNGSKSFRELKLPIDVKTTLERFTKVWRPGARRSDPLLLSERGNRLAHMSVYSKVRRMGQEVGLKDLKPQRLRRTYMVNLFQQEQDLRLVQQCLGHSSIKTTAQALASCKSPNPKACDACGAKPNKNHPLRQIESGQWLCKQCYTEFR